MTGGVYVCIAKGFTFLSNQLNARCPLHSPSSFDHGNLILLLDQFRDDKGVLRFLFKIQPQQQLAESLEVFYMGWLPTGTIGKCVRPLNKNARI